jgi:hypothetical protein
VFLTVEEDGEEQEISYRCKRCEDLEKGESDG